MLPNNYKVLLLLGVLVAVIFLIIIIRIFTTQDSPQTAQPGISPSPTITAPSSLPTLIPTQTREPAYQLDDLKRDYERVINKKALLEPDQAIRTGFISSLNNQSGILFQNSNFQIKYIKAADSFMVEILSNEADAVKSEAVKWFLDQGLSPEGVCNLPVELYLNSDVNFFYKERGLQFNPIPQGC